MTQALLDERVRKSLELLDRRGGHLLKAERELIRSTIKDLSVIADGELDVIVRALAVAQIRLQGRRS